MKSIIFDIDGTIWDTRFVVVKAWKAAFEEHTDYKWTYTGEQLGKLFGLPMDEIFKGIYPDISDEMIDEISPILFEYEHEYLLKEKPKAYPGVEEVISKLSEKYDLYVVTNGQKGYTEVMLTCTGLEKYFKGWMCYGDTKAEKAVTMKKLMERYDITEAVYVGDTEGDRVASEKAGIPFIYCDYGLGHVDNPKIKIDSIKELEKAIETI